MLAVHTLKAEPLLEQNDVFVAGRDGVFQYRIPALVTSTKGTLIAACDARKDRGGDPPNNIDNVCRRSFDGGRTWRPLQVVADFPGTEAAGDPCLLVDRQTGGVWVFYAWCPEGIGTKASQPGLSGRTLRVYAMTSDDDGATWSKPRDLNPMVKDPDWNAMWCSPGRGFQTREGRLLVPSSSLRDGVSCSQIFASDDHGKTWKTLTASGHNTNEHMAVRLSYDEGKTWPVSKVIHAGPAAYSCLTVLADGTIGLLYERGEKNAHEKITFARLNLEWLTDGKDKLEKEE